MLYYEKAQRREWYRTTWFYRVFICGHHYTGQIKRDRRKKRNQKHLHYRECMTCGTKVYID